jgi:hypothetical protein
VAQIATDGIEEVDYVHAVASAARHSDDSLVVREVCQTSAVCITY